MKSMDHTQYPESLKHKSDNTLRFIINDCKEAIKANPDGENALYYRDEINYCVQELNNRKIESNDKYDFMVVTSDGYWGKADNLAKAMENANIDYSTDRAMAYVGKDLYATGMGGVSGAVVIEIGNVAPKQFMEDYQIIEAAQEVIDKLYNSKHINAEKQNQITCDLEDIKDKIFDIDDYNA